MARSTSRIAARDTSALRIRNSRSKAFPVEYLQLSYKAQIRRSEAHQSAIGHIHKVAQTYSSTTIMSGEKRQASNSFGTSQLVKRQKSNVDLGSNAVVSTNTSAGNGALIQAVSYQPLASSLSQ